MHTPFTTGFSNGFKVVNEHAYMHPRSELLREPNLLIPGKKPVGLVKVDWSHPLTQGLSACFVSQRGTLIDIVGGVVPTTSESTLRGGAHGDSAALNGTNQEITFPHSERYSFANSTNGWIVLSIVDIDALGNAWIDNQQVVNQNGWRLSFNANNYNGVATVLAQTTGTNYRAFRTGTGDKYADGSKANFIATYSASNSLASTPSAYINGTKYTMSLFSGGATGTLGNNPNAILFGSRSDSNGWLDGSFYFTMLWNQPTMAPLDLLNSLYIDPYQFLIPA